MVLARKYRPRRLSQLIGQPVVVKTLANAFEHKRLHHAYMFSGPLGIGKTSVARILAAMENCEQGPTVEPCGKCTICNAVYEGKQTDIYELDAASNSSVNHIRDIKKTTVYCPVSGIKQRYYIIDEAHALSNAANEALLKLLEEPPAHIRFVLCTTDPQKVGNTVASRCQQHELKKVYWTQLFDHLKDISYHEQIEYEDGALRLCAKLSIGSVRNALQNLDKLRDYLGSGVLTETAAQELFGSVSEDEYYQIIDSIIGRDEKPDVARGLKTLNSMLVRGSPPSFILAGLIEHLDALLLALTCKTTSGLLYFSEGKRKRIAEQAARLRPANVLFMLRGTLAIQEGLTLNLGAESQFNQWFIQSVLAVHQKQKQEATQK